jgi:hypothetical protein
MHHIRLRLAAGLLTFLVGTSLAYYARRPGDAPDCSCSAARCRAVFFIANPSTSLLHPLETIELPRAARRLD